MADAKSQTDVVVVDEANPQTNPPQTEGVIEEPISDENKPADPDAPVTDPNDPPVEVVPKVESVDDLAKAQALRDGGKPKATLSRKDDLLQKRWSEAATDQGIDFDKVLDLAEDPKMTEGIEAFAKANGYTNGEALIQAAEDDILKPPAQAPDAPRDPRMDEMWKKHQSEKTDGEQAEYIEWKAKALVEINMEESAFTARFTGFIDNRNALVARGFSLKEAGEMAFKDIRNEVLKESIEDPERKAGRKALGLPESSDTIAKTIRTKEKGLMHRKDYLAMDKTKRVEYSKTHRKNNMTQFVETM